MSAPDTTALLLDERIRSVVQRGADRLAAYVAATPSEHAADVTGQARRRAAKKHRRSVKAARKANR